MLTFFSCRKITKLISDSQDRELPWQSWLVMKLHLFVCKFCSRFFKQIQFFNELMNEKKIEYLHQSQQMSQESRQRIHDLIIKNRDAS